MKVLMDLSALHDKVSTSMDIYALRLLLGLSRKKLDFELILLVSLDGYKLISKKFPQFKCLVLKEYRWGNRRMRIPGLRLAYNAYVWVKTVNLSGCDLLYEPYTDVRKCWKVRLRKLQTIHDIHGEKVTKGFEQLYYWLFTRVLLSTSDYFISISDFVQGEIFKKSLSKKKYVETIYNSILPIEENIKKQFIDISLDRKYILYVNTLRKYKNVITLIKAFNLIKNDVPHTLVIVGKPTDYWNNVILPYIKDNELSNRIVLISKYVSDSELASIYRSAALFVTTSLYEGFGYTPIEAAIYKVPVISSKETALFETTMGMLNYYEPPLSYNNLADKMKQVLFSPPSNKTLNSISILFKKAYDVDVQVNKVCSCINKCLQFSCE